MSRNTWLYVLIASVTTYVVMESCQGEQTIRLAQYTVNGQSYTSPSVRTATALKAKGLVCYPPLTDSSFLSKHRYRLACIVKNGASEVMEVSGKTFTTEMPANAQLAPVEIAYLLTYIGNSFGNKMGLFTQEEVQASLATCTP